MNHANFILLEGVVGSSIRIRNKPEDPLCISFRLNSQKPVRPLVSIDVWVEGVVAENCLTLKEGQTIWVAGFLIASELDEATIQADHVFNSISKE